MDEDNILGAINIRGQGDGMTSKNKRVCKDCGRSFTASAKWDYELCEDCSIILYEKMEKFWITEVLGLSEVLDRFLPSLPRKLFDIALKKYAPIGQYDIFDANSEKELQKELRQAAAAEKERLAQKVPFRTAKCKKCGTPYTVDGLWQYNICQKCAVQEVLDWRAYWAKQVPGIGTIRAGFDIPPIEVSRYILD
jgi:predicted Zn-ribbon and HTH transcriptional regulator